MLLDYFARRNLELTETLQERTKKGSLLWLLDRTRTKLGARLLRKWLEKPEISIRKIENRLKSVEELNNDLSLRDDIITNLNNIGDIERLVAKILSSVKVPDLLKLKSSLFPIPKLHKLLSSYNSYYLKKIYTDLEEDETLKHISEVYDLLDSTLCEENEDVSENPPNKANQIIKSGYNSILDNYRDIKNNSSTLIENLERTEKEKLGIKSLKIISNRNHYYIDIKNAECNLVPSTYVKCNETKLTTRFMTKDLGNLEIKILEAEEKITEMEKEVLRCIQDEIYSQKRVLKKLSSLISILDVFQSFAVIAQEKNYVKPLITNDGRIDIRCSRHPVVEEVLKDFVPNDCYMDFKNNRIHVITGPNMAGKSTYMRQVALICIMAEIGSFVPAESASICPVAKIYTRIGASDNLIAGQSTFMVEMSEVSKILNDHTKNSLILLDEIGRGTSTYDGVSIAKAILNYLSEKMPYSKVLFSTHYHRELIKIKGKSNGIVNYFVEVQKENDELTFLRKVVKGVSYDSCGIQVAKLANVPREVIDDAKQILSQLEDLSTTNLNSKTIKSLKSKLFEAIKSLEKVETNLK